MRGILVVAFLLAFANAMLEEDFDENLSPSISAYDSFENLRELEGIHPGSEELHHVEGLAKSAHMRRLTSLEHINNRHLHDEDLQRRTSQFREESSLERVAERADPALHHEHDELVTLQKQLSAADAQLAHDHSETLLDRKELEEAARQHKDVLRIIQLRRRQLERVRAMQDEFKHRNEHIPGRLLDLEHLEQRKVEIAEKAASRLSSRVARLQVAVQDAPKRIEKDYREHSSLRKAVRDANAALSHLHASEEPYFRDVAADAHDIDSRLRPAIAQDRVAGVAGVRHDVASLLEAAEHETNPIRKQRLLRKARNTLDLGRLAFHHVGEIVASPSTSKNLKSQLDTVAGDHVDGFNYNKYSSVLHSGAVAASREEAARAREDAATLSSTASTSPSVAPVAAPSPAAKAHVDAMIGDQSATELRQCLLDAHAMKEALAKNAVHRRQQLLSIGYCLEKLDRLQSMAPANKAGKKKSSKKNKGAKKGAKKSSKKSPAAAAAAESDIEEMEEDNDQESEDLVLASALELLNVDPKAAEEHGPDYIQRQLVEMGMQLRKRGQEEASAVGAKFESCHKYCAGATVTRVADIGKHRTAYAAASKHASALQRKLLRSKGAYIEARRFFKSARDTAKTRLDSIRSDLTLIHTLSDHVAAVEAGSASPAGSEDTSLMTSLEILAARRPAARSLLIEMTSDSPRFAVIRSMLARLSSQMTAERTSIINGLKKRQASIKQRGEHIQALRRLYKTASDEVNATKKAMLTAQGRAMALQERCVEMRQGKF